IYFSLKKVVATFQGRCEGFFRGGREPAGFRNEATLQICQQYKGRARFATLYNSNLRLPVYSAYLLHPHGMSAREDSWLIEPQARLGKSQALEEDYKGDPYDRGHLNPVAHQAGTNREATFTLTNVAPMHRTLNRGSWRVCEEQLRDLSSSLCPPGVPVYVLTGTSPPFLGKIPVTSPGRVEYKWVCGISSEEGRENYTEPYLLQLKTVEDLFSNNCAVLSDCDLHAPSYVLRASRT
uniref:Endonuclease n=1 Tax=Callorhinchus milii TaxID=7868 RepID=A0A4W3H5J3_CALMI